MRKISVILLTVFFISSCYTEHIDKHQLAIDYITDDPNLLPTLYRDSKKDSLSIFKNDEMLYQVYPEQMNFFYTSFSTILDQQFPEFYDLLGIPLDNSIPAFIDSTLIRYSNDSNASIKIFFSEPITNLLAAEVVYRNPEFVPEKFDNFRANHMSNVAACYLFVFKDSKIDTVYTTFIEYN